MHQEAWVGCGPEMYFQALAMYAAARSRDITCVNLTGASRFGQDQFWRWLQPSSDHGQQDLIGGIIAYRSSPMGWNENRLRRVRGGKRALGLAQYRTNLESPAHDDECTTAAWIHLDRVPLQSNR